MIVFQSVNKNLAKDVDYPRFRDMIERRPYFTRHFPFDRDRQSEMRFPNNIVVKPVSGQDTGALGQNVIGGIIDEVNFMAVVENSKTKRDGTAYDQAVQNYNAIARRRESRFMQKGALPGMLCLVSSTNYPGGMTDMKEAEARTNTPIYVYDKRLWELRPERFCGERFRVFVGDETRKPRIMDEDDVVAIEDEHLVVAVPVEYSAGVREQHPQGAPRHRRRLHPGAAPVHAEHGGGRSLFRHGAINLLARGLRLQDDAASSSTRSGSQHPKEPRFAHIDLATSEGHRPASHAATSPASST